MVRFRLICKMEINIHYAITIKLETTVTNMPIGQRPIASSVLLCYM